MTAGTPQQQEVERGIKELQCAIELCMDRKLRSAALVLLYSGIDMMAWFNRPRKHADVKPCDFEDWVDLYLLPESGIKCSANELYGARCGILHSRSAESRRSREGNAREVYYTWDVDVPDGLQKVLNDEVIERDEPPAVAVCGNRLIEAFFTGTRRFQEAIAADPNKLHLVNERANRLLEDSPLAPYRSVLHVSDATYRKLQRFLREQSSGLDKN